MAVSNGARTLAWALALVLVPSFALAAAVRVSWNPNTESDLEGYRVFCGTSSRSYEKTVTVGRVTSIEVSGLSSGVTYYFAVKAFDFSGNESPYSDEVSITIPSQSSSQLPSGTAQGTGIPGMIASFMDYLKTGIARIFDLDPGFPVYTLGDVASAGTRQETAPETDVEPAGFTPTGGGVDFFTLTHLYPVLDVVLESGYAFDLAAVFPEGARVFCPLSDDCPAIEDGLTTPLEPGRFLYLCLDTLGAIDNILRLSVVEEIYGILTYDPRWEFTLEDPFTGTGVSLPPGASDGPTPIAVGRGGPEAFAGSSVSAPGVNTLCIDIVPYGLELQAPAVVSIPFKGSAAIVERYDEADGTWVAIEDISLEDGNLSFSTQELGRFRVNEPREESSPAAYEPGGSSCFIGAASR